jgi:hypothetical protein
MFIQKKPDLVFFPIFYVIQCNVNILPSKSFKLKPMRRTGAKSTVRSDSG